MEGRRPETARWNMDLLPKDALATMTGLFTAMVFLVWILPGMVNRSGKYPEDRPARR